jgi:hypothetical protein
LGLREIASSGQAENTTLIFTNRWFCKEIFSKTFKSRLSEGLEKGEDGKLIMKISFPDEGALDNLAKSLARMVSLGN